MKWLVHLLSKPAKPERRYGTPNLHEGEWGWPCMTGPLQASLVTWVRKDSEKCTGVHRPARCTIGPGMAHVDICLCGKTRYGVYGSWS